MWKLLLASRRVNVAVLNSLTSCLSFVLLGSQAWWWLHIQIREKKRGGSDPVGTFPPPGSSPV